MGLTNSKDQKVYKKGVLYDESFRKRLRSFDIVFFNGGELISDLIEYCSKKEVIEYDDTRAKQVDKKSLPNISHVGMILRSDVFDSSVPNIQPDKIYIFESILSGRLSDGVNNVDGKAFLGVQLRDFDEVFKANDTGKSGDDTEIAVGFLSDRVRETIFNNFDRDERTLREEFTKLYHRYNGVRYDYNPIDLLSTIWKWIRIFRKPVQHVTGSEKWLFCSELLSTLFIGLGVFMGKTETDKIESTHESVILKSMCVNPEDVLPIDFTGVRPSVCPLIIDLPITYIVGKDHYQSLTS
jgi:hypothetical protein